MHSWLPPHYYACHLVDEVADVVWAELLRAADDLVQVCVHQLIHQVHVTERPRARRRHNVAQRNHVLMPQV
jgi:hypothetical protein